MRSKIKLLTCLLIGTMTVTHTCYSSDILPTVTVEAAVDSQSSTHDVELENSGFLESEFPGTVDVINPDSPHFSDSNRLEDFVDYIPGVQIGRLQAGLGTDVYIRGFSAGGFLYKDGLRDNRKYYVRDPSSIERVEITKGRDSVLYGSGSPGGTVNFVIKKPLKKPNNQITMTAGYPLRERFVWDSTGPLSHRTKHLFYRLIVMNQAAETGRKNVDDDRFMFMPSLLLDYGATQLRLLGEYSLQKRDFDFDTVLYHGRPIYNSSFAGPRNNSKRFHKSIDLDFKHAFSNNWRLKIKANRYQVDRDELLSGFWYKQDEETLKGYYREIENDHSQWAFRTEVNGQFNTQNTAHHLTVGFEKNRMKSILTSRRFSDFDLAITHPVFDFPTPAADQMHEYDYDEGDHDKALFLQDKVYLGDNWIVRAGLRKSWFYRDFYRLNQLEVLTDTDTLSSAFGVTYQPSDSDWAYFVSRVQSFKPNIGRSKNNEYFAPREGLLYETGFRYLNPQKKHQLKLGIYQITQSNLTTTDPEDRDFQILAGERQVMGAELSGSLPITSTLKLSVGYSFMQGEITKNNDGLEGNTPGNMPKHSGSLNLTYKPEKYKNRLKVNFGVVAVSKRQVSDRNKFTVPGYTRLDLGARYSLSHKTKINFSIKNVLDKDYIAAPIVEDVLVEGYPRRVMLSLTHQY